MHDLFEGFLLAKAVHGISTSRGLFAYSGQLLFPVILDLILTNSFNLKVGDLKTAAPSSPTSTQTLLLYVH